MQMSKLRAQLQVSFNAKESRWRVVWMISQLCASKNIVAWDGCAEGGCAPIACFKWCRS